MIEDYVRELAVELRAAGVHGRESRRLLREARDHLRDAASGQGAAAAVTAFGPAPSLARIVAAELATRRSRSAAYAAFATLAPVGLAYAVLFLTFPGAGAVQPAGGAVPGLDALAFAGVVFFPQLAFVCGALALVRALRRRGRTELPAADLAVLRRRTGVALAAGGLTLGSLGAFALDQHRVVPGWWLAASVGALCALVPPLAAVGIATARAGRPTAAPGRVTDTARDDVAAVLAHVPGLGGVRLPVEPRRFAFLVAATAAALVVFAGAALGDPIDGLVRGIAEGVAVLGCYRILGRPLGLRA